MHDLLCFSHFKGFQKNIRSTMFATFLRGFSEPLFWQRFAEAFLAILKQFAAVWGPAWVLHGGFTIALFDRFGHTGPREGARGVEGSPRGAQDLILCDFGSMLGFVWNTNRENGHPKSIQTGIAKRSFREGTSV